jgi:hypothetical protein
MVLRRRRRRESINMDNDHVDELKQSLSSSVKRWA